MHKRYCKAFLFGCTINSIMKNIFILTNFSQYLKSYSPIIVVGEQIKMFQRNGYNPVLIVAENWDPDPDSVYANVQTKRIIPAHVYNEPKEFSDQDREEIDTLEEQLNEIIPDGSVVLTHDLIFLPDYVKHNVAARRVAEAKPGIQWIHWIHSATAPGKLIEERSMYGEAYTEMLNSKFPHSIVAFPNSGDVPRVAQNFNYEEDEIFVVPHSTDPTRFMHPIIQRLFAEKELGDADIIMVLPIRLDRGKQAEVNVRIAAGIKQIGLNPRLIVCDFHSTGDDKVVYRNELKGLADELDVEDEVIFLSEFDESVALEADPSLIDQLFQLSNFFVFASKSETYSLVTQEAMSKGNFCILSHHFLPMRSIFGDRAIYRMFHAGISPEGQNGETTVNYENEQEYMRNIAMNMRYYLENDKVIKGRTWVRKERNPDAVFRKYLEPLLYRSNNE